MRILGAARASCPRPVLDGLNPYPENRAHVRRRLAPVDHKEEEE
jgi:hypothetical protein